MDGLQKANGTESVDHHIYKGILSTEAFYQSSNNILWVRNNVFIRSHFELATQLQMLKEEISSTIYTTPDCQLFRQLFLYSYTARHRPCTLLDTPCPAHQTSWGQCRLQIHDNSPTQNTTVFSCLLKYSAAFVITSLDILYALSRWFSLTIITPHHQHFPIYLFGSFLIHDTLRAYTNWRTRVPTHTETLYTNYFINTFRTLTLNHHKTFHIVPLQNSFRKWSNVLEKTQFHNHPEHIINRDFTNTNQCHTFIHWDHTLCRALVPHKQSPWLLGTILDGSPHQHKIPANWHSFCRPQKGNRQSQHFLVLIQQQSGISTQDPMTQAHHPYHEVNTRLIHLSNSKNDPKSSSHNHTFMQQQKGALKLDVKWC